MHDDGLDQATAAFLAGARQAYASTVAPAARPALEELFANGIASSPPVSSPAQAPTPSRRRFMFLDIFKGLPTKISAGALGAAIAVSGLGAGGALPVSMMLTSNEAPAVTEDVDPAEELAEVEGATEVEEKDASTTEPIDLTTLAVPTSVSEAAQTHAFDEACGNHGKYVSHFARFGEEPECATDAREAASGENEEQLATPESDEEQLSTSGHDDDGEDEGKGKKARGAKSGTGGGKGKAGGRR